MQVYVGSLVGSPCPLGQGPLEAQRDGSHRRWIRLLSPVVATRSFQLHDGDYKGIGPLLRSHVGPSLGGRNPRPDSTSWLSVQHRRRGHYKVSDIGTAVNWLTDLPCKGMDFVWIRADADLPVG